MMRHLRSVSSPLLAAGSLLLGGLLLGGPGSTPIATAQPPDAPTIQDARALLQQQDYEGAERVLRAITGREPDDARAWAMLGSALNARQKWDDALAANLKACELDPSLVTPLYNVACSYARKGETDLAFEALARVHATHKMELTQIMADPDLASLKDDPRFAKLLPTPEDYAHPFVEKVKVLHEWQGEGQGDQYGWIARNIGDVDGDGVNDVVTSAPTWPSGGDNQGRVYVYSGKSGALLWTHEGEPQSQLGLGVEAAGDVNADGIGDVIAGAPFGDTVLIFSGRDGTILRTLHALQPGEAFGQKVGDLGDFDHDGYDDVLVGAPQNDDAGEDAGRAYVFSGKDGSILLTVDGEKAKDAMGSAGGGLCNDEFTFVVVGAPNAGHGGRTYVYEDDSGQPAFVIEGDETAAQLGGMFVSVVGDVDADGTPDIYASDWLDRGKGPRTGRIYVHSGRTGERLLAIGGETQGEGFGIGPADAGDVDGDGHADLIIGAWQYAGAAPSGGKCYLVSGRDGSLLHEYTCQVEGETFGFDATGMGDVDGDGTIDLLLTSAWSGIAGAKSGRMFLVSSALGD
jgi:hypothetical protein